MIDSHKALLKASLPLFREHGETIAGVLYDNLLLAHPHMRKMFSRENQVNGHQAERFTAALLAYVEGIDSAEQVRAYFAEIHQRHVAKYVNPHDYTIIGAYLMAAIQSVLGDALSPEVMEAWAVAYTELAEMMIASERSLYLK